MARTSHKRQLMLNEVRKRNTDHASIWDRWQNDEIYRQSQLARDWSQMLGEIFGLFRKLISHTQRRKSKDGNENLLFLRSAIDEKQGLPLTQRPEYQEAKNVLIDTLKNSRKDFVSTLYPKI